MFTTEEKVNLLKKMQKKWIDGKITDDDWLELDKHGLVESFSLLFKKPEEINQYDIMGRK